MSRIVAFGYGLSKKNQELIIRMINNVLEKTVTIIDLKSYKLDISKYPKDTIFLIFGKKAQRLIGNIMLTMARYFPDPDTLEPNGDEEARLQVWQTLLELKALPTIKEECNIITESTLPELTAGDIKILEKTLKEMGTTEWLGKTKDGKSIRITVELSEKRTEEIQMTFSELYAIRMAMDILQLKEIDIAYNKNHNSRSDSDTI